MVHPSILAITAVAGFALAHPGHDVQAEAERRAEYAARPEYRSLSHCASKIKARDGPLIQRRMEQVDRLRAKRGIEKRNYLDVLATDHESNLTVTPESDWSAIFGSNATCILQDEVTEGPYYVSGEYVRQDITEGQEGVSVIYDVQIVDTTTCEPLADVALESWSTNATGVYGGVVANNNGNIKDQTNINNTALRGIQVSDADGILQIETLFPGHYTGRTNHIHVLAHIDAVVNTANNTLTGGHISHVGQLFFDQSLVTLVEASSPYSGNTQALTRNAADGIFRQEAQTSDPVLNYVLLGESVADGIFGWVTVGIDPTVSKTVRAAAYLDSTGGHATK